MSETPLHYQTLREIALAYRERSLSPVEVTRSLLERISALDTGLKSYCEVLAESATHDAERAEQELARGEDRGPLHGVPVAVKDLCATKGVRTAAGTRVLADRIPDHDATVVERLREAGAVLLGKLQLTEGAFSTHHPEIDPPKNPWDRTRWTGVSSSGSGVATASGLCFGSLGSDTGGSIRFPSACCGVVGLKPTYGRVPVYGVFPLSVSLDHVGPMTRSSWDAAALLGVLAGPDARDPVSLLDPVPDYTANIEQGVRGLRIGVDEAYVVDGADPQEADAVLESVRVLESLGAERVAVRLPDLASVLDAWLPVCAVEAAVAHEAHFPAEAEKYGPVLRATLEAGLATTGAEYARARAAGRAFGGELARLFEQVDVFACPSFNLGAPPLEIINATTGGGDRNAVGPLMKFTAPFDFSGSPTLSLPCGFSSDGLPLSLQLVGRHLDEALLCRAGHAFESATDWHRRHPDL